MIFRLFYGGKSMSDTRETTAAMGQKAGTVDESILSDEEKQQVDAFAKRIDILNIKMVNSYGTAAQKDISAFSSSMLGTVKTK